MRRNEGSPSSECAGGTLASFLEQEWTVFACVVTDEADITIAAIRRRETLDALACLGLPPQHVFFLGLRDGSITVNASVVERLRKALRERDIDPAVVFSHSHADCHNDHRAVQQLTQAAFRRKMILGFPIINSLNETLFEPRLIGCIGRYAEKKRQAIQCHVSQTGIGRVSLADIEEYNRQAGAFAGGDAAELFRCDNAIWGSAD